MVNFTDTYYLKEVLSEKEIVYFFVSKGRATIIKAIQYLFVKELNEKMFII
jgi:hypothetical protein